MQQRYSHRTFYNVDIIRFAIEGNLELFMAACFRQERKELVHIRGYYGNDKLRAKMDKLYPGEYSRDLWNPLLFAV